MQDKIKEALNYYRNVSRNDDGSIYLESKSPKIASIFGISRGGTTWLAELIGQIPNTTLYWEPLFKHKTYKINSLNPFAYPERNIKNFGWNPHIPQDKNWEEVEVFFNKLFNQKIANLKLLRFNDLKKIKDTDLFLYKFCFGNLLLPWLVDRFNIKPIFLTRHPAAMVASSFKFGDNFSWHKKQTSFTVPSHRFASEIYSQYQDLIPFLDNGEKILTFQAGVQYKYLIKHEYNNRKWLTVSYESLYLNQEDEIKRIFEYLNEDIPSNISENFSKTSFSSNNTHSSQNIKDGSQLQSWHKKLTKKQIADILETLERMNINFYNHETEPNYDALYNKKKVDNL